MTPDQIRSQINQIYAARLALEARLDLLDIELQNLQAQCQHPKKWDPTHNEDYWHCSYCDAEGEVTP